MPRKKNENNITGLFLFLIYIPQITVNILRFDINWKFEISKPTSTYIVRIDFFHLEFAFQTVKTKNVWYYRVHLYTLMTIELFYFGGLVYYILNKIFNNISKSFYWDIFENVLWKFIILTLMHETLFWITIVIKL